jgi:arylsulfatase A
MKKLLFCLLWLPLGALAQPAPKARPNIIYILMDDLGLEETSTYGSPLIQTPHLDQLAREGMKFTRHYAGTSVCAPSRCALMTGLHTGHCQVRGNRQMEPHGQLPLADEALTVAELLKKAGYQTRLAGKWGLGSEGTSGEPTRQGFDHYFGYLDQVLAHNNYPAYLLRNGQKVMLKNQVVWEPPGTWSKGLGSYTPEANKVEYSNDLFTQDALQFIDQQAVGASPFFLYLAYTLPHNNGEAPKDIRFQAPELGPYQAQDWPEVDKNYAATLARMDQYVGQLMAKLRAKGLAENTVIFFSSDNGSTEDIPARFAAHNRLRGFKRSPYEGGIRVPLVVWWPGQVRPGSQTDWPTAQWDFMATACQLAGQRPPTTDGVSVVPVLLGQKPPRRRSALYWEFHEQGGWQALQQGRYKLIHLVRANRYELYDLLADEGEKTDLAKRLPKVVARLKAQLLKARTPSAVFNF